MSRLPPLNALRAFEAAARTGSFVLAGRELGVTSAAVSQQVKALEDDLGKQLFVRRGNRLLLTDAGQAMQPRVSEAFGTLTEVVAGVRDSRVRQGIVVSVLPSLAGWLLSRLARFRRAHEDRSVVLRVEADPVSFAAEGIDLRLTYGTLGYGDFRAVPLFHDEIVPLISPALWTPGDSFLDRLPDPAFVHTNWGREFATHPTWSAWFARAGRERRPDPAAGVHLSWSVHAVAAAAEGVGAALGPRELAAREVAAGRLVIPSPVALPLEAPYVAILPEAKARRPDLRALIATLAEPSASGDWSE